MDHSDTIKALQRLIARNDWADPACEPGYYSSLPVKYLEEPNARYECWLAESILTGLSTSDKLIAFRCSLQAAAYREKVPGYGGSALCDAFLELRNRVEGFLKYE
jgi:hypothetical protein